MPPLSADRVAREDLVTFLNACFVCTGQAEYYAAAHGVGVSVAFLHAYVVGNYRRLYARCLGVGINHANRAAIVVELLAAGAPADPADRREESALLTATLRDLPPPRVYRLFTELWARRVNNRRARALVRDYLHGRRDLARDALKYRPGLRAAVRHTHLAVPPDVGTFLFTTRRRKKDPAATPLNNPLLDAWRRAGSDREAVFSLPFTVAKGFAAQHGIDRAELLQRTAAEMTTTERLRVQAQAEEAGVEVAVDLRSVGLTRLARYVLSLAPEVRAQRGPELTAALDAAARRVLRRAPLALGRVALVLDRSDSTAGSEARNRVGLAVALAVRHLVQAAARETVVRWTPPLPDGDHALDTLEAEGSTDLATPLLDALTDPNPVDTVLVVSDGYENDPPGGAREVLRVFRTHIAPTRTVSVVHLNPVFDRESLGPRPLGGTIPTIGLREAEDLPTALGFARFAEGYGTLTELEHYLAARVEDFLQGNGR